MRFRSIAAIGLLFAVSGPALAVDLTSPSFRLRGLHSASIGPAWQSSLASVPEIGGAGISLGSGDAVGPSGSATTLRSLYPGFWPLAGGALPSLDLDGDQRPAFLDSDDDGDGLLDVVETGTGIYLSASDTGTSSADSDSDDDGVSDGAEVVAGTDPNVPDVPQPSVPGLVWWVRVALAAILVCICSFALRGRSLHV